MFQNTQIVLDLKEGFKKVKKCFIGVLPHPLKNIFCMFPDENLL